MQERCRVRVGDYREIDERNGFDKVACIGTLEHVGEGRYPAFFEQVYGLPGVGWMILNGIYQRDYPVVQGGVLFLAFVFVFINLVADLLYAYVDPRIRYR